jgi:hypothetical protein
MLASWVIAYPSDSSFQQEAKMLLEKENKIFKEPP